MSLSKLNLIAIVAIVAASVSLFAGMITSSQIFAQGNSSGNNTRDGMGNFINGNTSSMTNNGHSLIKSYPTNSSI
jgi:hypothetical protein